MLKNEDLDRILRMIEERRLGRAMTMLENYLLARPAKKGDMGRLMDLQNDYRLMADYWQRGFDDPEREQVYSQLLKRLYVQCINIYIHDSLNKSPFMTGVYTRPRHIRKDWSLTTLRRQLESYVSDVAMLQLEPEAIRKEKEENLYKEHQLLMHDLFDYIITSRLWSDGLGEAFTDMLLSPTIDSADQQLIVSAITLSAMNAFGIKKFNVLYEVYQKSQDQYVRQRALTGWVLCADAQKKTIYPEVAEMIAKACENENTLTELTELQMQLLYCMSAEEDHKTIHETIIPDIIQGNNLKITQRGLVEMDEDSLEDILHPDAAERNMERMEESMGRMADMQKEGSDIYFGGFSQMKRFQFFNDLSNWFVPFYTKHPGISHIWTNTRGKKFLQTVTRVGAFCDSDKYSFVLAFEKVLGHLPQNLLDMIEKGDASPVPIGGLVLLEDQRQPAFIRRIYLQNLYRFFRLYPMRAEFNSPFDDINRYVFFGNTLFGKTKLEEKMLEVAGFMMKKRRYEEAKAVLDNYQPATFGYQYYMMMGNLLQRLPMNSMQSAARCFQQALLLQPDSEQALSGMAKASFRFQDYASAYTAYEQLLNKQPDHKGYLLNAAICLTNLNRNDDALKFLYKLDYLYPSDLNVKRVLSWVHTVCGNYDKAVKLYRDLLIIENPQPVDMLNFGLCQWLNGDVVEAIIHFKQFVLSNKDESFRLEKEFTETEYSLLKEHNISDAEIQLMLDTICP